MRHINFDESAVMGELLKIASQNGMIITAATMGENLTLALNGKKFDSSKFGYEWAQYLNDLSSKTNSLAEYNKSVSSVASKLSSMYKINLDKLLEPSKKFVGSNWSDQDKSGRSVKASVEMDAADNMKKRMDKMFNSKQLSHEEKMELIKDTDKLLKDLYEFEKDPYYEHDTTGMKPTFDIVDEENKNEIYNTMKGQSVKEPEMYCPWCEKGAIENGIITCPSCEAKMSKKASKDLYDVSGETAEDLVDTAHPGGGTETELTHKPEGDGALVETVVEQHEADKEIAMKDPTGAYASLIILKSRLSKMGLNKYANKVNDIINEVIPKEIILAHKITVLLSKLTSAGYSKYASEIYTIIKKKVVKQAKVSSSEASRGYNETNLKLANLLVDYLSKNTPPTLKPMINKLASLASKGFGVTLNEARRLADGNDDMTKAINDFLADSKVTQLVLLLNDYKKDMNAGVSVEIGEPVIQRSKKKLTFNQKVKDFQEAWNTYVANKYKPTATLKEDGLYGPKTKDAASEVGGISLNAVKNYADKLGKFVSENTPKKEVGVTNSVKTDDYKKFEKFENVKREATDKVMKFYGLDKTYLSAEALKSIDDTMRAVTSKAIKSSVGSQNPDLFISQYIDQVIPKLKNIVGIFARHKQ